MESNSFLISRLAVVQSDIVEAANCTSTGWTRESTLSSISTPLTKKKAMGYAKARGSINN
jgi:hypothetical protein